MCDLCGPVKCPYVPPHPFNLDFPQLMLRYRAIENKVNIFRLPVSIVRIKILMENKYLSQVTNLKNLSNLSTLEVYFPHEFVR